MTHQELVNIAFKYSEFMQAQNFNLEEVSDLEYLEIKTQEWEEENGAIPVEFNFRNNLIRNISDRIKNKIERGW